jgi:hypothetical protein
MAKYIKMVPIEAVRWDGTEAGLKDVFALVDFEKLPTTGVYKKPGIGFCLCDGMLVIPTLEGDMTAQPGDWIAKGVNGEICPIKHDVFVKSYRPLDEQDNEDICPATTE